MGAWRRAATWRARELFVVLEDDVSLSAHWYRATVNMWQKYGDRSAVTILNIIELSPLC